MDGIRAPVLVIEGDDALRAVVAGVLADEGYPVVALNPVVAALEPSQAPTVCAAVIVGVYEPQSLLLMDALRQRWPEPAPIIALTSFASDDAKARNVGAAGLLSLPFDIEALVTLVGQHARN
jgi:CheY-like chemotaxis protein